MDYFVGASFNTYSRQGFIKACHILANGLTIPKDNALVVSITGEMNVGKALVADAFLNALTDEGKNKKYDVPKSSKMAFEAEPAQAAHFSVRGDIMYEGRLMPAHFARNQEDLDRILKHEGRQIIFLSRSPHGGAAHLQIDLSARDCIGFPELLQMRWKREWTVHVLKPELYNDKMNDALIHLNNVRGYQIHKRALDL